MEKYLSQASLPKGLDRARGNCFSLNFHPLHQEGLNGGAWDRNGDVFVNWGSQERRTWGKGMGQGPCLLFPLENHYALDVHEIWCGEGAFPLETPANPCGRLWLALKDHT